MFQPTATLFANELSPGDIFMYQNAPQVIIRTHPTGSGDYTLDFHPYGDAGLLSNIRQRYIYQNIRIIVGKIV